MKKLLLGAVALAASAFTSAMAADLPVAYKAPPPPVPVFSWTGCYLGGNAGGGRTRDEWEPLAGQALNTVRASGWFGGVQVGCDYQVGSWVFGVEGQFDWSDMNNQALVASNGAALQLSSKLNRFATATGRIGYAFDRVLLYVKGGAAWAHFDHEVDQSNLTGPFVPVVGASQNVTGFVVGGGFEVAFLPNWSFKAEYNYLDFGTNGVVQNCIGALCAGGGLTSLTFDIKQNIQTFMVGLNYRFGGYGPVVAKY